MRSRIDGRRSLAVLIMLVLYGRAGGGAENCTYIAKVEIGSLIQASERSCGRVFQDFVIEPEPSVRLRVIFLADAYAGGESGWSWVFALRCADGRVKKIFEELGPIRNVEKHSERRLVLVHSCEKKENRVAYEWVDLSHAFSPTKLLAPTEGAGRIDPQLLKRANFERPPLAQDGHHWSGLHLVRLFVSAEGTVQKVEVQRADCRPVDEPLVRSFEEAALKWGFTPGTKDGAPVDAWATITVQIRMR
ncbi:MAG: hypothetical protein HYX75_01070 [Acidobacteria bacterium]|nr:hypothetical protein [Acidobacteriota bacterium]